MNYRSVSMAGRAEEWRVAQAAVGAPRASGDLAGAKPTLVLKFPRSSTLLYPAVVVSLSWSAVTILYSLHLSTLLLFSSGQAARTSLLIACPIIAGSLLGSWRGSAGTGRLGEMPTHREPALAVIAGRVRRCWRLWMLLAAFETAASGGLPLVWILTNGPKNAFDYGISSLHGLVDGLLIALATTSFALFLYSGDRRHLRIPVFAFFWSILIVSRGMCLVMLLECGIVYARLRRTMARTAAGSLVGVAAFVLGFGYLGDLRGGVGVFRNLAQPTGNYPDWAPSGLLWAYIYVTTPINNLMLTMRTIRPSYDPLFPNTISTLFPTVLRAVLYKAGAAHTAVSGALVIDALNVSTAFTGPFEDMGVAGVAGFGAVAGFVCARYWHGAGFRNIFFFTVFTSALSLTIFYNLFFDLPLLGQLIWFSYFTCMPKNQTGSALVSGQAGQACLTDELRRVGK